MFMCFSKMTLSISRLCYHATCRVTSIVMLINTMLAVIMLSVVMLSVKAQFHCAVFDFRFLMLFLSFFSR